MGRREGRFIKGTTWDLPSSFAFFCPYCGQVWARAHCEGRVYRVWAVECSRHPAPSWTQVAGSLWLEWDKEFTACFPPAVMEREVQIHLAHAEKWGMRE